MRHARFLGDGRIEIGDSPWPVPAVGEVLLRVSACSLCGSDLRPLKNGWPVTPGHEIAGVVDQPGHRLHRQRCLVYIPVWCGHCATCSAGHTQLCENATDLVGWQRNGGYAEALAVPEQCLLPIPGDVPDHLAPLLLDTIGTAAHGVRLSQNLVPAGRAPRHDRKAPRAQTRDRPGSDSASRPCPARTSRRVETWRQRPP